MATEVAHIMMFGISSKGQMKTRKINKMYSSSMGIVAVRITVAKPTAPEKRILMEETLVSGTESM